MTDEITFTLTPAKARVVAALCALARKNLRNEISGNPEGAASFAQSYAGVNIRDMLRAIDEVTELFLNRTAKLERGQQIYNDAGPEQVEA